MIYNPDLEGAKKSLSHNKEALNKLKKKGKELDPAFHRLHEQVFEEIDCLQCSNCCKTTSPLFIRSDIERLAKVFKLKPNQFIDAYLKLDEDGDYVLTNAPCPFLGLDNKCLVYEQRPKACREYPHTNRKRMYQIVDLTLNNSIICPAVARIVKRLTQQDTHY